MLHTVGLALVVGANAVFDLRLLGAGAAIPLDALRRVFRVMLIGFAINASSGLVLFVSEAADKGTKWIFWIKLLMIALALIVAWMTKRRVFVDRTTVVSSIGAPTKALAALSLVLWLAAITAGRLMAYAH